VVAEAGLDFNHEAIMKTLTTRSIGDRARRVNLRTWAAVARALIGAAWLTACGPGGGAIEADGGTSSAPDSSVATIDTGVAPDAMTTQPTEAGPQQPLPPNQTCTVGAQCASGFCVDGACCNRPCDGACESCGLTGKIGVCSPIRNATDDSCDGDSICDGSSECRKVLGKVCAFSSECASGHCVDGVCCGSAACGTCQACAIPGSEGTCVAVSKFVDDIDSNCSGERTCDGLGACRFKNGRACGEAAECTSLQCVDGVCCNQACTGTCYSCNQQGNVGTCTPVNGADDPSASEACTGSDVCTAPVGAAPACKIRDGEPCSSSADCLNGSCVSSYRDADGDGYGHDKVSRCERSPAAGYVTIGGDCCDSDAATHPGATTYSSVANACGGFDRNCDGKVEQASGGTPTNCGCAGTGVAGKLGTSQLCIACR
jgi:hypothetical protein